MWLKNNKLLNYKEEINYIQNNYLKFKDIHECREFFKNYIDKGNYLLFKNENEVDKLNKMIEEILFKTENEKLLLPNILIESTCSKYKQSFISDNCESKHKFFHYFKRQVDKMDLHNNLTNTFSILSYLCIMPLIVFIVFEYLELSLKNPTGILFVSFVSFFTVFLSIRHDYDNLLRIFKNKFNRFLCKFKRKSEKHLNLVNKNRTEFQLIFHEICNKTQNHDNTVCNNTSEKSFISFLNTINREQNIETKERLRV